MKSEMNAHIYRKMKQAKRNFFNRITKGGLICGKNVGNRRTRYWARQYNKWLNKLINMPLNK